MRRLVKAGSAKVFLILGKLSPDADLIGVSEWFAHRDCAKLHCKRSEQRYLMLVSCSL